MCVSFSFLFFYRIFYHNKYPTTCGIDAENLNEEAAKRYITASLKREYASDNGTELNEILSKLSPLNPQYLTKKQSVFQKMSAFVDKFKGVGGRV